MKTVDDLLKELKSLEITKRCFDGSTYKSEVVSPDGFYLVEKLIRGFFLDQQDNKIGEMQGKIFAYEEIIKKSNFAPIMPDNHLQDVLLNVQKVISEYENKKMVREIPTSRLEENPFAEETKETTEEETMFISEFRESADWKQAGCIEYFDLSGNEVVPNNRNKILKYYKRELGNFKFLIVFVGE